jgi:flagellar FliJ protein
MNPRILDTLIEQASAKAEAAQVRYASLRRMVDQANGHLATLRQYAREYEARARCQAGDRRDPSAERNQVQFLARLQEAVQTQVREVEIREAAAATASQELAQCRQRLKSLETLAQRRREQLQRMQTRREQKHTDEFAQRAHERTASAGSDS